MSLAPSRSALTVYLFLQRHQAGHYLCSLPECLQVTESFNDGDPSRLHEKLEIQKSKDNDLENV